MSEFDINTAKNYEDICPVCTISFDDHTVREAREHTANFSNVFTGYEKPRLALIEESALDVDRVTVISAMTDMDGELKPTMIFRFGVRGEDNTNLPDICYRVSSPLTLLQLGQTVNSCAEKCMTEMMRMYGERKQRKAQEN